MALEEPDKSPLLLPWDRFQNWLHCVCVVTFDLEVGQAMEVGFIATSVHSTVLKCFNLQNFRSYDCILLDLCYLK